MLKNILATIGLLSALIGIFRFFYVEELPKIEGTYVPYLINGNTKFLDILDFVDNNRGKLVFIDLNIDFCDETKHKCPFPRYGDGGGGKNKSVSYEFHWLIISENFPDGEGNYKDISSDVQLDLAKISNWAGASDLAVKKALEKILSRFLTQGKKATNFRWLLFDNGTSIKFHDDISNISPYSTGTFGSEGSDQIYGVYSIKYSIADGSHMFDIVPAAIDSNIMKRAECTLKKWNKIRKFFQCPFL